MFNYDDRNFIWTLVEVSDRQKMNVPLVPDDDELVTFELPNFIYVPSKFKVNLANWRDNDEISRDESAVATEIKIITGLLSTTNCSTDLLSDSINWLSEYTTSKQTINTEIYFWSSSTFKFRNKKSVSDTYQILIFTSKFDDLTWHSNLNFPSNFERILAFWHGFFVLHKLTS